MHGCMHRVSVSVRTGLLFVRATRSVTCVTLCNPSHYNNQAELQLESLHFITNRPQQN